MPLPMLLPRTGSPVEIWGMLELLSELLGLRALTGPGRPQRTDYLRNPS